MSDQGTSQPEESVSKNRRKKIRRIQAVWSTTGGRCVYCNARTPIALRTVDHLVPASAGGPNAKTNLLPACYRCNHARGTTSPASSLAHPKWKALVQSMEKP